MAASLLMILAVALLFSVFFIPRDRGASETGSSIEEGDGATLPPPGLSGVTFTTTLGNGGTCVLETERISLRSRMLDHAVFESFKEIAVSRARVTLKATSLAEVMDWMAQSRIVTLSAPLLADRIFRDRSRLLGVRLVVENLQIVTPSVEGGPASPVLTADSAACDPFSDQISFTGCLRVSLGEDHFLFGCDGATWDIPTRTLHFTGGYFQDDAYRENGAFSLSSPAPLEAHGPGKTLPGKSGPASTALATLPGRTAPGGAASVDAGHLQAILKEKEPREANRILLELLALNPALLNRANITPFSLLGPGFKLGAFKPPPLLGRIQFR